MSFDCEKENKIRFRDPITDKVGFFDRFGKIAIPAVYEEAYPFHNGLAVVMQGAKRICWEGREFSPAHSCEHWSWQGGRTMVINEKNVVLIDSFSLEQASQVDWYSLATQSDNKPDKNRFSFKGTNGKYYFFLDKKAIFTTWFYDHFLSAIQSDVNQLSTYCFREVAVDDGFKDEVWRLYQKSEFLKRYKKEVVQRLKECKRTSPNASIILEDLNPYIFEGASFREFYDDCDEHNQEKYPVFTVVLSHYQKGEPTYQEHFEFLRTPMGYRLILVSIHKQK
jgi:hypothetical protein